MLEILSADGLAARLGFTGDDGKPDLAPIANAVRQCVAAWGRPPRQRVSAYLHRQLQAAGFGEEEVQASVKLAIDGLLDIGDLVSVRLDGNASLVLALPQMVMIGASEAVLLGDSRLGHAPSGKDSDEGTANRLARHITADDRELEGVGRVDFDAWIGPAAYLAHLRRRSGDGAPAGLADFWAYLTGLVEREGAPVDLQHVRAVVHPPGHRDGFFGRHNRPGSEGRWSATVPTGLWCAARAGRNANEWHPIVIDARGNASRTIDCYDWDEWSWALRARGVATGGPERMSVSGSTIQFEQQIPRQFQRALRLLGSAGGRAWSWDLPPEGIMRFEAFCERLG